MRQNCRKQLYVRNLPVDIMDFNIVTNSIGFGKNDGQPGNEIPKHSLHRQADTNPSHTDAGNQCGNVDSDVMHRHEQRERKNDEIDQPQNQHPHRRLHVSPFKGSFDHAANPARRQKTDQQNDNRPDDIDAFLGNENFNKIDHALARSRINSCADSRCCCHKPES